MIEQKIDALTAAINRLADVLESSGTIDLVDVPPFEPAEKKVTMDDIQAMLGKLVNAGKREEVKELISSFGAARLSEIPAEKYGEVMKKAEVI